MHGEVDAEALLGAIDEFLAEGGANVDGCQALAVAQDRRHAENAQRLAARFDADDRLAGLDRLHHGVAARRDVVAEDLGRVNAVEHQRRRRLERDQRDALAPISAFIEPPSSASSPSRSPLAMASPTGGSAAMTALTASVARPS